MPKYRQGRINEEMARELSDILRGVKDPRVSGALVSVTAVDCSADLKFAKIYFSVFGGDREEAGRGLKSAAGYIRTQLAERLNLRVTPELKFYSDGSIEHGARISELIKNAGSGSKEIEISKDGDT